MYRERLAAGLPEKSHHVEDFAFVAEWPMWPMSILYGDRRLYIVPPMSPGLFVLGKAKAKTGDGRFQVPKVWIAILNCWSGGQPPFSELNRMIESIGIGTQLMVWASADRLGDAMACKHEPSPEDRTRSTRWRRQDSAIHCLLPPMRQCVLRWKI